MKDFLKYLEAHLQGNPGIPGQRGIKPGEEDYLTNASKRKRKELGIHTSAADKILEPQRGIALSELMSLVGKSEHFIRGHETELEALANKAIKNLYKGLIERYQIEFDIKLSSNTREIARLLGIHENSSEIYKRKIINLVSQGEALNTKHILHSPEVKEGISEIFGDKADEIFEIWDSITKAATKLDQLWDPADRAESIANSPGAGLAGAVDVKWVPKEGNINEANDDDDDLEFALDDEGDETPEDKEKVEKNEEDIFSFLNTGNTKGLDDFLDEKDINPNLISKNFKPVITAIGRDFPMLLHEAVKGLYNVLAMGGIPEDKDVARLALKKGYARNEEPEEWKYGPTIAADIRDFVNENELVDSYSNVREQVWKYMVSRKKMPTEDFLELIRGILSKTQEARIKVDAIIKMVVLNIKKFYEKQRQKEQYEADMEEYRAQKEQYDREIEEYNKKMEEWNKKHPTIEEEPQEVVETPYSEMTQRELQAIQDQALEDGDYKKAAEVSKYIK